MGFSSKAAVASRGLETASFCSASSSRPSTGHGQKDGLRLLSRIKFTHLLSTKFEIKDRRTSISFLAIWILAAQDRLEGMCGERLLCANTNDDGSRRTLPISTFWVHHDPHGPFDRALIAHSSSKPARTACRDLGISTAPSCVGENSGPKRSGKVGAAAWAAILHSCC
jgi:hypothetical protein